MTSIPLPIRRTVVAAETPALMALLKARERIEQTLEGGLRSILMQATRRGHWGDVRGTADCLLAVDYGLSRGSFDELRNSAVRWLVSRSVVDDADRANWEEEVWDTAVGLLALSRDAKAHGSQVQATLLWLDKLYASGNRNWNDEPWETLWALLAIHACLESDPDLSVRSDLSAPLRWLAGFIDSSGGGILINWHYSALFSLVSRRYCDSDVLGLEHSELKGLLREKRAYLTSRMLQDGRGFLPGRQLWTRELWSNSLVLWALAESDVLGQEPLLLGPIAAWMEDRVSSQGAQTEDMAFACIALSRLLVSIETAKKTNVPLCADELHGRCPDDAFRKILTHWQKSLCRDESEQLKARLTTRLAGIQDHVLRPPVFTSSVHDGYYTMNLTSKWVHVWLIAAATAGLTMLSLNASDFLGPKAGAVFSVLPIALGALATLFQILDLRLGDIARRFRSDGRDHD